MIAYRSASGPGKVQIPGLQRVHVNSVEEHLLEVASPSGSEERMEAYLSPKLQSGCMRFAQGYS